MRLYVRVLLAGRLEVKASLDPAHKSQAGSGERGLSGPALCGSTPGVASDARKQGQARRGVARTSSPRHGDSNTLVRPPPLAYTLVVIIVLPRNGKHIVAYTHDRA